MESLGDLERRLPAELHHHALGLLVVDYVHDILEGQRLEVQAIGGVVVGGDRLRVAVDHDGLVAQLAHLLHGMHAAVVELDPLPDAVRPAAQDDDRFLVGDGQSLVLFLVGGVEVGRVGLELGRAGVDGFVGGDDAFCDAPLPDLQFAGAQEPADVIVAEAEPLGLPQFFAGKPTQAPLAGERLEMVLGLHDLAQLLQKPLVDERDGEDGLQSHPPPVGFQDEVVALGRGDGDEVQEGLVVVGDLRPHVEFPRAHRFLEGLFEGAADGHVLAHALHVRGQSGIGQRELLEGPARRLHHHVVDGGLETGGCLAGDVVGDLVQRVAHGQLGGDLGDGEAGGLGGQSRGARYPRVHLDDHQFVRLGGVGELDVGSPRLHADGADDVEGSVAQPLVLHVGEGLLGRDRDGVACVHAHGIDVLDGAHDDHVVFEVAHDLEFELLPPDHALLEQHLMGGGRVDTRLHDGVELLVVGSHPSPVPPEREAGTDDQREVQPVAERRAGLGHALHHGALGYAQTDGGHGLAELVAGFGAVDGRVVGPDELHPVLLERTVLG